MLPPEFGKGLIRALHDALAANINPRACRHLTVHHEALAIERIEMLPRRPMRYKIRIGDEDARCIAMRAKNAYRLA